MSALRVVIADDEEIARRRVARLLRGLPDVEIAGECKDGTEVLKRVAEGDVDVLLLDIQMPGLTGLEAMALLPDSGPYVIFCTAYAEHAVDAFDIGAVDYLLKPFEAERLEKALDRARSREAVLRFQEEARQQRARRAEREETGSGAIARLAVPTKQGIVLLDPNDVSHAVLDGELVTIHANGISYLTDDSLQSLEARLAHRAFERVHRRALLNLDHVARLEPCASGGYVARTHRGEAIEVSRQAARALRRRLGLRKGPGDED